MSNNSSRVGYVYLLFKARAEKASEKRDTQAGVIWNPNKTLTDKSKNPHKM